MEQKTRLFLVVLIVYTVIVTVSGGIPDGDCFQRRLKRAAWRCCGSSDFYNPRTQICCAGSVYDLSSGTRCCDRTIPYNPSTHICCNGAIRRLRPGSTRCCGQRDYNPLTETCCGGRVVTAKGRCCGGQPFIPQTQVCCAGKPVPRPPHASIVRCCGYTAYDQSKHSCCRGGIRPLGFQCGSCLGPCCDGKWRKGHTMLNQC